MSDINDPKSSASTKLESQKPAKPNLPGESGENKKTLDKISIVVESSSAKATPSQSTPEPVQVDDGRPKEINGPRGLEPTRYGDWESKGRCYDF